MFTKRHERELAEIKTLTEELGERLEQIQRELEQIKMARHEPQANAQSAASQVDGGTAERRAGGRKLRKLRKRRHQSAEPAPSSGSEDN